MDDDVVYIYMYNIVFNFLIWRPKTSMVMNREICLSSLLQKWTGLFLHSYVAAKSPSYQI